MIKNYLKSKRLEAIIRFETNYGEDNLSGYTCNFRDIETGTYDKFTWFYPVVHGKISSDIMREVFTLYRCGFRVKMY